METNVLMLTSQLLQITIIVSLSIINAHGSFFLDYCFWEGSIFQRWLPWLAKKILYKKNRKKYNEILLIKPEERDTYFIQASQNYFLYKILGGCIVCSNVWLAILTFIPIYICLPVQLWHIFPYIFVSSRTTRKISDV